MEILKKNKYIVIGITFLFVGFIVYNNFIKKEEIKEIKDIVVAETDKDSLEMLNVLDKIKNIEIKPDFFNQKPNNKGYALVFSELDPSEPRPNKKIPGKINPFILGGAARYEDLTKKEDDNTDTQEESPEVKEVIVPTNNN